MKRVPTAGDACLSLSLAGVVTIGAVVILLLVPAGEFAQVIVLQLAFLAAAAVAVAWRGLSPASLRVASAPAADIFQAVIGAAGLGLALVQLVPLLDEMLPRLGLDFSDQMKGTEELIGGMMDQSRVLTVVLLSVLPAVCEEALFRGVVLAGFSNSFGRRRGLVYTALMFGALHVVVPQVLATFVIGLYLGALVLRSGSLWTGVAGHATNNFLALTLGEPAASNPWVFLMGLSAAAIVLWNLRPAPDRAHLL